MKILILYCIFFSSYTLALAGHGDNEDFVKSVACAYKDGTDCQKDVAPLSDFKQCPEDELGLQGAISFGITYWAVSADNRDTIKKVIRYLLTIGCDIDRPNINGMTSLHNAVVMSSLEAVKFLLDNGADPFKEVSKSKNKSYRNPYFELNVFDLVKKLHTKNSVVGELTTGNTEIYHYIQQRFPSELDVLPKSN